jgi:hypothetical protein
MYAVIWSPDRFVFEVRETVTAEVAGLRDRRDQVFDPTLVHGSKDYRVLHSRLQAAQVLVAEMNGRLMVDAADGVVSMHWPAGNPVKIEIPGFIQGLLAYGSKLYLVIDEAKFEALIEAQAKPDPVLAYLETKCFDLVTDYLEAPGSGMEPGPSTWRRFLLYALEVELGKGELLEN